MTNDDTPSRNKNTTSNNGNYSEPTNINAHLRNKVAGLEHALDAAIAANQVPTEITQALRAPMGTLHTVTLTIGGQRTRVVVNSLGAPDPEREIHAWRDIVQAIPAATTPGRQLRAMDPAIAAVEIGAAVLLNTEQTRAAFRAALRLLRTAPILVPAPVAWLWQKARSSPARAGAAAVVAVAAIGAAGMLARVDAHETHLPPPVAQTRLESVVTTAPPSLRVTPSTKKDKREHDRKQPEQTPPPGGKPAPVQPAPKDRPAPNAAADSAKAHNTPRPSPRSAPPPRANPRPSRQANPQEQSSTTRPTSRPPTQQPTRGPESTSRPPSRPPATRPATQRPDPTTQAPHPTATATQTQHQPTQAPTTQATGGGKNCHLVEVDIHLPPIGVGVCL